MTHHTIAVLGSGSWGTALALTLARNHHQVVLWGRDKEAIANMQASRCNQRYLPNITLLNNIQLTSELVTALNAADYVLVAVPSHAFASILNEIQPYAPTLKGLIWATKGFDDKKLLHEVAEQIFPADFPMAMLAGPSFATEVGRNLPTAITLAGKQSKFLSQASALFHSTRFRVYTLDDLIGVQIGGAVKNVLAIAAGINDGLGFGMNARAALLTRGMNEMIRLGEALGGQRETFMGLAGLGDLILTCNDNQSRNRRFGLAIGQGMNIEAAKASIQQTIEGITTATTVYNLSKRLNIDMPICQQVYNVLALGHKAADAVEELMARKPKNESF